MAGIPSVQVFLGEETTIDATPTWVDISSYVRLERGLTTSRGQSYGADARPVTLLSVVRPFPGVG